MKKYINRVEYISGQMFGNITFLNEEPAKYFKIGNPTRMANFQCHCGKEFITQINSVKNGHIKGCGCWKKSNITHGKARTSEYRSWAQMKDRCSNLNSKDYKNYGGRGITVCDRWLNSFENFLLDMGEKPEPTFKHSIERNNVNGDYEPGNCRWATTKEQARNKRTSRNITLFGQTHCVVDWSKIVNVPKYTIKHRLKSGKSVKEAFSQIIIEKVFD